MTESDKIMLLAEANQEMLKSVCNVDVSRIFALLHAKASVAAEAKGVKIENTAADGNDAKDAVFHSAGEHMIVARSLDGEKIAKKDAKAGLVEYVSVFLGADVGKKLRDDEIFPLESDGSASVSDDGDTNESIAFNKSFKQFVGGRSRYVELTEAGNSEESADEEDPEEYADEEDPEEETGEETPGDESGEEDTEEDPSEEDPEEESGEEYQDGDGAEQDEKDSAKADGFYILYGLKIKGMKETALSDAVKKWGSNFIKSLGVEFGSRGGGGSDSSYTVGDATDAVSKAFGSIKMPDDTDEITKTMEEKLRRRFPSLGHIDVNVRDRKTIISELDKVPREGYDGRVKQKINMAEYSLYVDIDGDDPRQPFVNRKIIAETATASIQGLFKKFRHRVSANDVIFLRGPSLGDRAADDRRDANDIIPLPKTLERKLNLPEPNEMPADADELERRADDMAKVVDQLVKIFTQAKRNKKKAKNPAVVDALLNVWDIKQKEYDRYSGHNDKKSVYACIGVLRQFLKEYSEQYKKFVTNESAAEKYVSWYGLMCLLFEDTWTADIAGMFEDDTSDQGAEYAEEDEDAEDDEYDDAAGNSTEQAGSDIYLIPMPGIKAKDADDDAWKGGDK